MSILKLAKEVKEKREASTALAYLASHHKLKKYDTSVQSRYIAILGLILDVSREKYEEKLNRIKTFAEHFKVEVEEEFILSAVHPVSEEEFTESLNFIAHQELQECYIEDITILCGALTDEERELTECITEILPESSKRDVEALKNTATTKMSYIDRLPLLSTEFMKGLLGGKSGEEEIKEVKAKTTHGWTWEDKYMACSNASDWEEFVELVIESYDHDVDKQDAFGNTLLHVAIKQGEVEAVKKLLEESYSTDMVNNEGENCLSIALVDMDEEMVEVVLEDKVVLIAEEKRMVIEAVIKEGNESLLETVLEFIGVLTTEEERMVLESVIKEGNENLIEMVLEMPGTDIDFTFEDGDSVLMKLSEMNSDSFEKAVELSCDLNIKDAKGRTLFERLLEEEDEEQLEILLENGVDLELPLSNGESVEDYIAKREYGDSIRELVGQYV